MIRDYPSAFVFSLAAALSVACGADFDPPSRLSKLRVLAVRSDAPFAKIGETVSLDLLAFDPEARPLRYGFALCKDPPTTGALDCVRGTDPQTVVVGDEPRLSFAVPEASRLGVVVAACPGTLSYAPPGAGRMPFVCEAGGRSLPLESFELGQKRIFLRERDRNENPSIVRLTWDGADWPEGESREADACEEGGNDFSACPESLSRRIAAFTSPPERGLGEDGLPFAEQQIVQYYATEGIFESEVRVADSPETRWVARRGSPPHVRLHVVVRDDRGGVGWTERTIVVR